MALHSHNFFGKNFRISIIITKKMMEEVATGEIRGQEHNYITGPKGESTPSGQSYVFTKSIKVIVLDTPQIQRSKLGHPESLPKENWKIMSPAESKKQSLVDNDEAMQQLISV